MMGCRLFDLTMLTVGLSFLGTLVVTILFFTEERWVAPVMRFWALLQLGCSFVLLGIFQLYPEVSLLKTVTWFSVESFLFDVGIFVDTPSALLMVMVTTISFFVLHYSTHYLRNDKNLPSFLFIMSVFTTAMLGLCYSPTLLQFFLCWEIMGVCSFLLIGFSKTGSETIRASRKAFLMTKIGDLGFLLGIVLIILSFSTTSFGDLTQQFRSITNPSSLHIIIGLALLIGVIGKSAQFPLHTWLPDAMVAPTPASALIHAATMVTAGVILLIRFHGFFRILAGTWVGVLGATLGIFTMLIGAIYAVVASKLKQALAYSTISQLGSMIVVGSLGFAEEALYHLLTHAFFKALLFLTAGIIIHMAHSPNLHAMKGYARKNRTLAFAVLVGYASLMGFPFTSGFWSKEALLGRLWAEGYYITLFMCFIGILFTAIYSSRILFILFSRGDKKLLSKNVEGKEEKIQECSNASIIIKNKGTDIHLLVMPQWIIGFLAILTLGGGLLHPLLYKSIRSFYENAHTVIPVTHRENLFVFSVALLILGAYLGYHSARQSRLLSQIGTLLSVYSVDRVLMLCSRTLEHISQALTLCDRHVLQTFSSFPYRLAIKTSKFSSHLDLKIIDGCILFPQEIVKRAGQSTSGLFQNGQLHMLLISFVMGAILLIGLSITLVMFSFLRV